MAISGGGCRCLTLLAFMLAILSVNSQESSTTPSMETTSAGTTSMETTTSGDSATVTSTSSPPKDSTPAALPTVTTTTLNSVTMPSTSGSNTNPIASSTTTTTKTPQTQTSMPAKGSTEPSHHRTTTHSPFLKWPSIFGHPPHKPKINIKWVPLGTILLNKIKNHPISQNINHVNNNHHG